MTLAQLVFILTLAREQIASLFMCLEDAHTIWGRGMLLSGSFTPTLGNQMVFI